MRKILHRERTMDYKTVSGIPIHASIECDAYSDRSVKGIITLPMGDRDAESHYMFNACLAPLSTASCIPDSCIHYLRVCDFLVEESLIMLYDSEWIVLPKGFVGCIILDIILRTFIDEYRIVSLPPKAGQIRYV